LIKLHIKLKSFLPAFTKKQGWFLLRFSSRKTNPVLLLTLTQKLFACFFPKKRVDSWGRLSLQKEAKSESTQMPHNSKVFCLLLQKREVDFSTINKQKSQL